MAPWSPSEMAALLHAWREDVETPAPLLHHHQQQQQLHSSASTSTLYERFVGLCGGKTQRSEASVLGRRDAFKAMWSLISAFNREQQYHSDPEEQQRLWFDLREREKRMVFAKKSNGKPHNLLDVSRATFAELDEIMAIRRRQIERERQRVEAEKHEKSADFLRASASATWHGADNEAVERLSPRKRDDIIIISRQDTEAAEDSGSSTESDEEVVLLVQTPLMQRRPVSNATVYHRNSAAPSPPERREHQSERHPSTSISTTLRREDDGWHPIITHKNKRIKLSGIDVNTNESENQSTQKPKASEVTSNSSDPTSRPVPAMIVSSMDDNESRLRRRLLPHPHPPPTAAEDPPALRSAAVQAAKYCESRLQQLYSSTFLATVPAPMDNTPAARQPTPLNSSDPAPRSAVVNVSESRLQRLYSSSAASSPPPPIDATFPAVHDPTPKSSIPNPSISKSRLQKLFESSASPPPIDPAQCAVHEPATSSSIMAIWPAETTAAQHHGQRLYLSDAATSPGGSRNRVSVGKSRLYDLFSSSPSTTPQPSLHSLPPTPPSTRSPPSLRASPTSIANNSKSRLQRLFSSSPSIDHPSQLPPRAASPPTSRASSVPPASHSESRLQNLFSSAPPTPSLSIENAPAVREPDEVKSPAVCESVADTPTVPLWLSLKPESDRATSNPAVQKLISTLLDKHANIPRRRQYRRRQAVLTPPRSTSDLGVVAEVFNAQASQLNCLFDDFQATQQADAAHRNQFLADVQRDEADEKRFQEEVEQLEARIKRARDEWTQERELVTREWEQLRAKRSRS